MFESKSFVGPITCLFSLTLPWKPFLTCVLVGCGPFLSIYELISGKLLNSLHVFHSTIHGLRYLPSHSLDSVRIVVFGEKDLCLLELLAEDVLHTIHKLQHLQLSDWILDICLLEPSSKCLHTLLPLISQEEKDFIVAGVGFAHNFVQFWKLDYSKKQIQQLGQFSCEDSSLL